MAMEQRDDYERGIKPLHLRLGHLASLQSSLTIFENGRRRFFTIENGRGRVGKLANQRYNLFVYEIVTFRFFSIVSLFLPRRPFEYSINSKCKTALTGFILINVKSKQVHPKLSIFLSNVDFGCKNKNNAWCDLQTVLNGVNFTASIRLKDISNNTVR